ncbi:hypothetical protein KVT40_005108 [Elsinoe batatas]|uniref:AB hydrolase-1 domain-containing protein n=1 Tax=Elsinoe batatas TaxID=2601811 RepID=A0A8K0L541_9PEZI|nr:hypothetical protein KVT40_005108 [Elsinoe batatas]
MSPNRSLVYGLSLLILPFAYTLPAPQHSISARAASVQWTPCPDFNQIGGLPIECGSLAVPLDYTDDSNNATVSLQLRRVAATNGPARGSILLNYGGPGYNGIDTLAAVGALEQTYRRLIFCSTLRFSCYPDAASRTLAQSRNVISSNASDTALGKIWAVAGLDAETCFKAQNATGELIGTGFNARDFMQAVDALEDDGLLRYWGYSYGTYLGATLAAMYPDRVERMVLDGVVNPIEYTEDREVSQYADADLVFDAFTSACANNSQTCPLAISSTGEECMGGGGEVGGEWGVGAGGFGG